MELSSFERLEELESLPWGDLKTLAKQSGIKARKKVEIVSALQELWRETSKDLFPDPQVKDESEEASSSAPSSSVPEPTQAVVAVTGTASGSSTESVVAVTGTAPRKNPRVREAAIARTADSTASIAAPVAVRPAIQAPSSGRFDRAHKNLFAGQACIASAFGSPLRFAGKGGSAQQPPRTGPRSSENGATTTGVADSQGGSSSGSESEMTRKVADVVAAAGAAAAAMPPPTRKPSNPGKHATFSVNISSPRPSAIKTPSAKALGSKPRASVIPASAAAAASATKGKPASGRASMPDSGRRAAKKDSAPATAEADDAAAAAAARPSTFAVHKSAKKPTKPVEFNLSGCGGKRPEGFEFKPYSGPISRERALGDKTNAARSADESAARIKAAAPRWLQEMAWPDKPAGAGNKRRAIKAGATADEARATRLGKAAAASKDKRAARVAESRG